ncbi:hypothetical protein LXL04_004804 [Taraxacum kok-saghyz]
MPPPLNGRSMSIRAPIKFAGYSRYGKSSFFKGVMLPWAVSKYEVTYFIYATASIDLHLPLLPNDGTLELIKLDGIRRSFQRQIQ